MATKSSIHIKPCNIASSEAHNRRTTEYMRNIGKSKIYIVPELSANNEPVSYTHLDVYKRQPARLSKRYKNIEHADKTLIINIFQ